MQILDSGTTLLSNYEVLKLVQESRKSLGTSGKKLNKLRTNFANITYDVEHYLRTTPCVNQTPEILREFLIATKDLPLSKLEKLQILNNKPKLVELFAIIDTAEERFDEAELMSMVETINKILPAEPTDEDNTAVENNEVEQVKEGKP